MTTAADRNEVVVVAAGRAGLAFGHFLAEHARRFGAVAVFGGRRFGGAFRPDGYGAAGAVRYRRCQTATVSAATTNAAAATTAAPARAAATLPA